MNALAQIRYEWIVQDIEQVLHDDTLSSWHRKRLHKALGDLAAMKQIVEMVETISDAKTAPALRVVK